MIEFQKHRIGLVITTPEELLPTAKAMAGRMQRGQFAVQMMAKVSINNGLNTDMETGAVLEASLFGLDLCNRRQRGHDCFCRKRKPAFPGK